MSKRRYAQNTSVPTNRSFENIGSVGSVVSLHPLLTKQEKVKVL